MSVGKISFRCNCGQKLNAGLSKAGQSLPCPKCNNPVLVPAIPSGESNPGTPQAAVSKSEPVDDVETTLYKVSPSMFRNNPVWFVISILLCVVIIGIPILIIWYIKCIGTVLTISNKRTTLRQGILSKSVNEVWHDNVRNVQLSQTLFQRIFGTGTLGISSAGQSGMEILVKGIPNPDKAKKIIDQNR